MRSSSTLFHCDKLVSVYRQEARSRHDSMTSIKRCGANFTMRRHMYEAAMSQCQGRGVRQDCHNDKKEVWGRIVTIRKRRETGLSQWQERGVRQDCHNDKERYEAGLLQWQERGMRQDCHNDKKQVWRWRDVLAFLYVQTVWGLVWVVFSLLLMGHEKITT